MLAWTLRLAGGPRGRLPHALHPPVRPALPQLLLPPPPRRHAVSVALRTHLNAKLARAAELEAADAAGGAHSSGPVDAKALAAAGRERASLSTVLDALRAHDAAAAEVADLSALAHGSDPELAALAREELGAANAEAARAEAELLATLVPADEADARPAIVEVRAGTGGDEAALFAGELLRMYEAYAGSRGWKWGLLSLSAGELGGVREASASLGGAGAFGALKYESGVHRVQRVPVTDSTGRLHTSTATVAVLPEAGDVDVTLRPGDLRIDTYRAGGAGGQHVNTTDSAVRITHIPSGLVVSIQDERSQHQNKAKAMRILRARLFEAERERATAERVASVRAQIGRAERSERVRTYNFAQDRVTDHRVGATLFGVEAVLRGERLDELGHALGAASAAAALEAIEGAAAAAPGGGGRGKA